MIRGISKDWHLSEEWLRNACWRCFRVAGGGWRAQSQGRTHGLCVLAAIWYEESKCKLWERTDRCWKSKERWWSLPLTKAVDDRDNEYRWTCCVTDSVQDNDNETPSLLIVTCCIIVRWSCYFTSTSTITACFPYLFLPRCHLLAGHIQ